MRKILITTTLAALALSPAPALARVYSGWVVRTTTMRAGPDYAYPPVRRIWRNSQVAIFGCLNDWSWCDVGYRYDRGWVAGRNLVANYRGRRQGISPYLGIGILSFIFGNYWDNHYRGRAFYNERSRWERHYYNNYQPHWGPRPNIPQAYQDRNRVNSPVQAQRRPAIPPQVQHVPDRNLPEVNKKAGNKAGVPKPNPGRQPTARPIDQNRTRVNVARPQGSATPQGQPATDRNRSVRGAPASKGNTISAQRRAQASSAPARQNKKPDNKAKKGNKKDKSADQPRPQ